MSRSQKWKDEWAFFLDGDGRRKHAASTVYSLRDLKTREDWNEWQAKRWERILYLPSL